MGPLMNLLSGIVGNRANSQNNCRKHSCNNQKNNMNGTSTANSQNNRLFDGSGKGLMFLGMVAAGIALGATGNNNNSHGHGCHDCNQGNNSIFINNNYYNNSYSMW